MIKTVKDLYNELGVLIEQGKGSIEVQLIMNDGEGGLYDSYSGPITQIVEDGAIWIEADVTAST